MHRPPCTIMHAQFIFPCTSWVAALTCFHRARVLLSKLLVNSAHCEIAQGPNVSVDNLIDLTLDCRSIFSSRHDNRPSKHGPICPGSYPHSCYCGGWRLCCSWDSLLFIQRGTVYIITFLLCFDRKRLCASCGSWLLELCAK